MNRFEGKSVLVTGGTSGIGLATARAFALEGARVVVTGRDLAALEQAKAALGANALAIRNDAGSISEARELAAAIAAQGIKLDAIFIRVAQVESFTDAVITGTIKRNIGIEQTAQRIGQRSSRGIENRQMVKSGASRRRRRTTAAFPGV